MKDYFKIVRAEEGIKVKLAAGMKKFIKNIETKKRERLLAERRGLIRRGTGISIMSPRRSL